MLDQFEARLDGDFAPVGVETLRAALSPLLPPGGFVADVESLRAFESDGLAAYRSLPACVVMPETTAFGPVSLTLILVHPAQTSPLL